MRSALFFDTTIFTRDRSMKFSISILMGTLLLLPALAMAEKSDVIILKNGDRVTGEIKKLEAGLLEYKTDTMGTVTIEWRFISEIISSTSQSVELTDLTRVLGTLQKPEDGEHILVKTVRGPVSIPPEDVVSVWPVEATFVDRMNLDVSFGLDYEKATKTTDLNAAIDFRLRGDERLTEASLRSDITRKSDTNVEGGQSATSDQTRWEFDAFHEYLLGNQRFRNWFGKIESNDATGVDLRTSGGGAFGKYLKKPITPGLQYPQAYRQFRKMPRAPTQKPT